MINLIVTSTALNTRLVQEAHKRKLSAVSWVLLLREQGMQKNKLQPKARLSSIAVLVLPCCPGWGCWCSRPGDHHQHVVAPSWVWSCHTSLRAAKRQWNQQRECAMDVSLCPSSEPAVSAGRCDNSHGQTARRWQNQQAAKGTFQIMKSYTLCTSARPQIWARKPVGQMISHWEVLIFRVKILPGVISLTIYRGTQVKFSHDCGDRTPDAAIICNV